MPDATESPTWFKRAGRLLGLGLAVFLLINGAAMFLRGDRDGNDATRETLARHGWTNGDLNLVSRSSTHGPIGQSLNLTLMPKDTTQRRLIILTLRRPLHLMAWQADYTEQPIP